MQGISIIGGGNNVPSFRLPPFCKKNPPLQYSGIFNCFSGKHSSTVLVDRGLVLKSHNVGVDAVVM